MALPNMHRRQRRRAFYLSAESALTSAARALAGRNGYTFNLSTTVHEDCLALSWAMDLDRLRGLAFGRNWAARQQQLSAVYAPSGRPVPAAIVARNRQAVADACHQSFAGLLNTDYYHEAYVFHKDSEVPPRVLEHLASNLLSQVAAVPLHHYYLITREQTVVGPGQTPSFTPWRLEPKTYPDLATLADVCGRMFPDPCPPKSQTDKICQYRWLKPAVAIVAMIAILISAGVYIERSKWFDEVMGRFDALEHDLVAIDASLSDLEARYAGLEFQLAQLAGDVARRTDVDEILAQLAELERRILVESTTGGGFDEAPCALSQTDPRAPAFLLRAQIGADGVRVFPYDGAVVSGAARRNAALSTLNFTVSQPMGASEFRQWAQAAYDQSVADQCRHFAIVNETGQGDAAGYAALRAAVESRFYIVRAVR
ncbi:MAG: hypothetical protein ACOC20_02680 [Oceanicaulis sp.]